MFWFAFSWWLRMLNISLSVSQPFEIPLLRILFWSVSHFLKALFGFLCMVSSDLCVFDINSLFYVELMKTFSHFVGCCFCFIDSALQLTEAFQFHEAPFIILSLCAFSISVLFRKLSSLAIHSMQFPHIFFISISKSSFMVRSLILLDLSFSWS